MKRVISSLCAVVLAAALSFGCAGVVVVRKAPPTPRVEVRTARPGPRAVWIDGHWKWKGKRYVWVKGRWVKNPKGVWVPGHWKKTRRGHVWVKGYWKR